MPKLKTGRTRRDVEEFLNCISPPLWRDEAWRLDAVFRKATGFRPAMWGESIVGYGRYRYRYESGHTGESLATGFSPRAKAFSVYIMPGYGNYGPILERLGKHQTGRSCLYITRLADIDLDVLGDLIKLGLRDLEELWPVNST